MFDATSFLKIYAAKRAYEHRRLVPDRCQEAQLKWLCGRASGTVFGKQHGLGAIRSVEDYQKAVPIRSYEEFWHEYFKGTFPRLENILWPGLIKLYAVSSGTSSASTKYLPISPEMLQSNKKAALDLLVYHLQNFPGSKIFGGRNFFLGGSAELVEEAPGIFSGDLSGIVAKTLPFWVKPWYYPPLELALIKNWEEKMEVFAKNCPLDSIRLLSGVPSWILIFLDYIKKSFPSRGTHLKDFFPNLEILVHGGVNFAPYLQQLQELMKGSKAQLRETYPASEGFIAIADRAYGEGLRMNLDTGIFYEFVPIEELDSPNPTRHWIKNVEKDVNYALIMTTCAGLWSYKIGDTVRFVDFNPPRILVTGRTSYMMSAFGEHLIGEEIETAIAKAAESIGESIADYSVGALYPTNASELGGHLFIIEFTRNNVSDEAIKDFSRCLDQELQRNDDYKAHRADGFGLQAPCVKIVPKGTFNAWMKSRGKLGGQNKVPRIINDQELFTNLRNFSEV
ncbi:MAG: GH3 auxin-responsive promoter family protein [SAR324 cluster bacterium]|uniref:GH3 auxin-responsive promoter family protein n=1 Tax=SAR324 cluster bacterium TaxID=2024889 RepID=A0A7X9FPQ2_9DELT|nr:GH3 auxin-responsive promoter family protein [SAR324 cluster bacterium]